MNNKTLSSKKEFGGYLSIDTYGQEYFSDIDEKLILRMNAARYAIVEACRSGRFNKTWIPLYICNSVPDTFDFYEKEYEVYNIDENMEPMLEYISEKECILITNFYGQKDEDFYERMIKKYKNVIFDNTQSFFKAPIIKDNVYNVYSPRKFVGVPDGAYLIGCNMDNNAILEQDYSGKRCGYLFESFEHGTNNSYAEYLAAQQEIKKSGAKYMSRLTRALLSNINYTEIREKRNKNYQVLCKCLNDMNEYPVNDNALSPMIYPLLIQNDDLRSKLVRLNVYVSQWWKAVISISSATPWEKYISKYLLPLPIDQRNTEEDMLQLVSIVRGCLEG